MAVAALPPLSLYVHLPWCVRKCPYCDFNSHRAPALIPEADYVAALLKDLDRDAPLAAGRPIDTVFFGGGTPSLFSAAAIGQVLAGVDARLGLDRAAEITLEANPGTIERGRFSDFRAAGVNRISLGVQSFDDAQLRRLGRIHGADEARRAAGEIKAAGFDNWNIDLMYALPGQRTNGALDDIESALALGPTHISHYQLTIEANTAFAARPPTLPDEDQVEAIEIATRKRLGDAGFGHYETSAWAKPEREARHNLAYWTFADYLGIGAGAHGKLTAEDGAIVRTTKVKMPTSYLARAAANAAFGSVEPVAPSALPFEFALNALRLHAGFSLDRFASRTGLATDAIARPIARGVARGWLVRDGNHIVPTALGRRFANDVLQLFMV